MKFQRTRELAADHIMVKWIQSTNSPRFCRMSMLCWNHYDCLEKIGREFTEWPWYHYTTVKGKNSDLGRHTRLGVTHRSKPLVLFRLRLKQWVSRRNSFPQRTEQDYHGKDQRASLQDVSSTKTYFSDVEWQCGGSNGTFQGVREVEWAFLYSVIFVFSLLNVSSIVMI